MNTWIETYTGEKFSLMEPRVESVNIKDIAHSLAYQCRFGGHCRRFYSVAEHSVRASTIVDNGNMLPALLHDAAEAYIGDMTKPLKLLMGAGVILLEEKLLSIIHYKFNVGSYDPVAIKKADNIMLATEARDLMPRANSWDEWLCERPLDDMITPWSAEKAEEIFLERFEGLTK